MPVAHVEIPASTMEQNAFYNIIVIDPLNELSPLVAALQASRKDLVFDIHTSIKSAKKAVRKQSDIAMLLVGLADSHKQELFSLIQMVRGVIKNYTMRIIACASESALHSETQLIATYQINAYRQLHLLDAQSLEGLVTAELINYDQFQKNRLRREAEINLLTALARFSRFEMSIEDCFVEFNKTIGIVSGAVFANVLALDEEQRLQRSNTIYSSGLVSVDILQRFVADYRTAFNETVNKAVSEGTMQICLDAEVDEHKVLSGILQVAVSGSLTFPLKSHAKTLAIVQCFLPKAQLEHVSVELIQLVEKSSDQLSVLLERREAEANLQKQYERVKETLQELKATKDQLYQSEKMASVGQLAAGIAHEINNPIAFVMGNFPSLDEYVDSMAKLLELHNEFIQVLEHKDIEGHSEAGALKESIMSLSQKADIEFVLEDVRSLVADSYGGLTRVKEIIANLKDFSHVDKVEVSAVDLHKNIDTTLKMLNHQLKHGVDVIKDYGDLPEIPCNGGLINQVFMNLLQNAIHAVDGKGEIRIKTCIQDGMVHIIIRDNGSGIPEDKLQDIFNPFFTTKPVGQGTGLGLSVSYGIVEKHNGKIVVDTKLGEYTQFTVSLPVVLE